MEELKNKEGINEESEEEKYLSDYEEENDILCQTNYYDNINNIKKVVVIKKFNVYFYLNFNKSKQYVIPVYTENFNIYETRIYDLIKYIVKKINNSNISLGTTIRINLMEILISHGGYDHCVDLRNYKIMVSANQMRRTTLQCLGALCGVRPRSEY